MRNPKAPTVPRVIAALSGLALFSTMGCSLVVTDEGETTKLNPSGPPMVQQVFMNESFEIDGTRRNFLQAAFGSHPDLDEEGTTLDDGVQAALARDDQKIRVVLDELILGNYIEEVACDAFDSAGDQVFSRIPPNATPDDVARCSPPELTKCSGENAICVVDGSPVGILDTEQDGAPDQFRMIRYEDGELAVRVFCDGGDGTLGNADDVAIPLNQDTTFYNPSGNQLVPAGPCGFDCLGPAIVINLEDGMRTSSECGISFQDKVFDKDLNQVCAPPNGDLSQNCSPGDTTAISWRVERLRSTNTFPADGSTNATAIGAGSNILVVMNASMAGGTLADIDIQPAPPSGIVWTLSADDPTTIEGIPGGPLAGNTAYTVTVPTTVTDRFGGPLPEEFSFTFTTVP